MPVLTVVASNPASLIQPSKLVVRHRGLPGLTGLSLSTIHRLRAAGDFPQPFRLSTQAVGYDFAEIVAWIEARKASRQQVAA